MTNPNRPSNTQALALYRASLSSDVGPGYMAVAVAFLKWLRDRPMDRAAVEGWLRRRRDTDLAADGTLHHEFSVIRRLYIAALGEKGWPFRRGDAPVIRQGEVYAPALGPMTTKELVEAAKGMSRPTYACFLALSTTYGLRRIEMASMTRANLKNGLLYVETAKHGRQRYHLIPGHIKPYIERWGFQATMGISSLTYLFEQLKKEIKLVGPEGKELGFHSIRRQLEKELEKAHLTKPTIRSFMRWKTFGDISDRYAASQTIERGQGQTMQLSANDEDIDREVFAHHPFLTFWE